MSKLALLQHIRASALTAKNFTSSLIAELAHTLDLGAALADNGFGCGWGTGRNQSG